MNILSWLRGVKNLRGIVIAQKNSSELKNALKILKRYHRYRDLGFSPLLQKMLEMDELGFSPFVPLTLPDEELENWLKRIAPESEYIFLHSLALSLVYLVPLIFLDEQSLEAMENFCIWSFSVKSLPEAKEQIRHLRIASYAMIDFLLELEDEIKKVIEGGFKKQAQSKLLKRYQELLEEDAYRYWRIKRAEKAQTWLAGFSLAGALKKSAFQTLPQSPLASLLLGISLGIRWS